MEQYKNSGPSLEKTDSNKDSMTRTIEDLSNLVDRQDQQIRNLEREVKKLRTDLRIAINTFNSVKNNG